MTSSIVDQAKRYIHYLSEEIPNRRVGSPGNQAATKFYMEVMRSYGFIIESTRFDCIDWYSEGVHLSVGGDSYEAFASPYSLGCEIQAPLITCSTLNELKQLEVSAKVVLMRGELTREQLMPKNFPFYNPESHKELIAILESKRPSAIITATSRDLDMVGGLYPFPVFEDGDFNIPSVYITDTDGARLSNQIGEPVSLLSRANRVPSQGWNVIARKGLDRGERTVIFAHIDSRLGTPGANDNASGVAVLMLLGQLLSKETELPFVELIALNGEDYYAAPGEKIFIHQNEGRFDEIRLGINLDDVGYIKGRAAYSLYNCPKALAETVVDVFSKYNSLIEGQNWYQGDHGLFLMNQVPALAITSEFLAELMAEITHTAQDTVEKVDSNKLVEIARALQELLLQVDRHKA